MAKTMKPEGAVDVLRSKFRDRLDRCHMETTGGAFLRAQFLMCSVVAMTQPDRKSRACVFLPCAPGGVFGKVVRGKTCRPRKDVVVM